MIKTEKLTFEYIRRDDEGNVEGITKALDDVNMNIQAGEFVAVLGANGSGKSTFAKHLNALLFPTEGAVWVNGMDTASGELLWKIRQSVGMVFQNPDNQIIGQIVEEDVAFAPENMGVETSEIRKRVDEALKTVGMEEYREYSPGKLSGGQKQRVSIAGIIAMRPQCIVFDEPTAMLDPLGRKEVIDAALKLNRQENITIILITHYMEEIAGADRVFVMDRGRVAMQGTPREIFSNADRLKSLRLGIPEMTMLAHELRKRGIPVSTEVITAAEMADEIKKLLKKG